MAIDRLDKYNLTLHIGEKDFQVLVTDTASHQVMLIEDYLFSMNKPVKTLDILTYIFDDHHLLMAGFWDSVSVSWKNDRYAFVPEALYSEQVLSGYLRINGGYSQDSDIIFRNLHQNGRFYTIFAGNREIYDFIGSTYPSIQVKHFHQSSVLIESLINGADEQSDKVILFSDRYNINIAVFKDSSFLFYNQFPIHNPEDYTRFINLTAKELGIELNRIPVTFYGFLETDSWQYKAFHKFISQLEAGKRPKDLIFHHMFDELKDHQYFDLFSVYLANNRL